jgi:hypothetical protein
MTQEILDILLAMTTSLSFTKEGYIPATLISFLLSLRLENELKIVDNEELERALQQNATAHLYGLDFLETPYKNTTYFGTLCTHILLFVHSLGKKPMGQRHIRNLATKESVMNFFHKWYVHVCCLSSFRLIL